jgi:hypothetical protein
MTFIIMIYYLSIILHYEVVNIILEFNLKYEYKL